MPTKQRPYIGVAVIVVRDGRVLLGRRKNAHGAGTWQFPGGHLEFGESIEDCARRELMEETGLTIERMRMGPFTNDHFEAEGKHYVTLFVIAESTAGEVRLREPDKCSRWDWFPWPQVPHPPFLPIVNLLKQGFTIGDQPSAGSAIKRRLAALACPATARHLSRFFKTGPGDYGEGDIFLGIKVPQLRRLIKAYQTADLAVIEDLLHSPVHEHRHLALLLLIQRYANAGKRERGKIVAFYLANTAYINNWDLVDCSAHAILGDHLLDRERSVLYDLVRSPRLWDRRIAMVATWRFIRTGDVEETFRLAALLLEDSEDLIHKSAGWMLREAGKRDEAALLAFIDDHHGQMPRTMLRYAIERFPADRRRLLRNGIVRPTHLGSTPHDPP